VGRLRKFITRALLGGAAVGAGAALFVVATNVAVGLSSNSRTYLAPAALPSSDIIIVPGSPTSHGKARAVLEERLRAALSLFEAGRAKAILVSGSETAKDPEVSAMIAWLEDNGVPRGRIVADTGGLRTRETMTRAVGVFDVGRAIVCTDSRHLPRALFLARASGIDALGFAPSTAPRPSARLTGVEMLKTTLAVVEAAIRPTPERPERRIVTSMR
jgi:vancomycin permeability regulator SanA